MKPKELALSKAQGAVFRCFRSLSPDTHLNRVKAALRQEILLVSTITHAVARLMNHYQQRGECLQEFNFEFSELIHTVSNKDPSQIMDPLNIIMHVQKLFNLIFTSKMIHTSHQSFKKNFRLCS